MLGSPSPAGARDTVVTSFDGTPIVTHFYPAAGLQAGARAPTVLTSSLPLVDAARSGRPATG